MFIGFFPNFKDDYDLLFFFLEKMCILLYRQKKINENFIYGRKRDYAY